MTLGVILAGGESRRMGQPKALVTLPSGMTMLDRAIALMTACVPQCVVSVPSEAALQFVGQASWVAPVVEAYDAADFPGLTFLPDAGTSFQGPMQGVATVAKSYPGEPLLCVCVDQIALTDRLVRSLLPTDREFAQPEPGQVGPDIAFLRAFQCEAERLVPFPVWLSAQAARQVAEAFDAGERSLNDWLISHMASPQVVAISLGGQGVFQLASANTLMALQGDAHS